MYTTALVGEVVTLHWQACCIVPCPLSTMQKLASAGAAGRFSRKQLALLDACIPGGIRYQEPDAPVRVQKEECAICWHCSANL